MNLIDRDALMQDISESVAFSVRKGETSQEVRGANKVISRIEVAPTIERPQTPCDLCKYDPPSSFDGKPCTMCPACGKD